MASSLKFAIAVLLVAYLYARLQHGWYLDEPREAHMVRLGSKVVASDLLKRGRLWRDVTGGGERPRHNSLTNRPHWFLDSLLLLAGDIELNPGPLRKGVRPMPNVTFMGKFVMCDGTRCIGSKCTFPHSESEMYVWNLQKFGQPAQNAVQTGPGRLGKGIRPVPNVDFDGKFVLCDETRCIGSKCTFPHSEAEKYAWNLHRSGEPVQSGAAQKDAQQQQEQVTHAGETGMFEEISQSDSRQSAVSVTEDASLEQWHVLNCNLLHYKRKQFVASVSDRADTLYSRLDCPVSTVGHIVTDPSVQTARGGADIDQASHWETVARKKKLRNVYKQNDGPVSSARYRQDASPALKLPLTSGSYKQKFKALLYAEQNEHQKILETKYNGHCTLQQYERGYKPYWLNSNEDRKFEYVRFGILTGLDNDKIAYVAQASSRLTISKNAKQVCKADVLRENISSVDEHLYIGFNEENSNLLETSVCIREEKEHVSVGFELKHFYFNSLRQAVDSLPDCVIQKICPTGGCFQVDSIPDDDLKCYKDHCSRDQFSALKVIASCSARSPPVIISGAFGTGKTRLLAIASRYFIDKERTATSSTRVLVCTQQWVSADFFLKCYHGLMTSRKDTEVYVVKDYGFLNPEWKNFYKTIDKFKIRIKELPQTTNLLVISTCLTAPKLLSKNAVPHGFFTHIMLDEGAQTREPEAIAPLRMATVDTKIVIAGDKNQVGPHVLVLGDEARGNGLAVSLQQRLEERYQSIGVQAKRHLATLNTSYRCHKDILELTEELFYDDVHFVMPIDQKTPTTHQLAPYPLLFVCSSVDSHANAIDKATNEIEADIVLNEVLRFSNPWPHLQWGLKDNLSQMCVISVSRKQLAVVKKLIKRRGIPKLSQLCCCPTYDIQGKEYHAVFLSTSEQTDDNGFTTNPTKSLCDPYIFNTAITRAQSLVVSVGNPFLLLKMENHDDMIKRHGNKRKCWTNYIMRCLQNDTITFPDSLDLTEVQKTSLLMQLKKDVEKVMCRRIQWTVDSQNKQTRDNHSEHVEQLQKVDSVHIEHPHSSEEASGLHLAAVESENWSTSESYLTKYKRQQAERQPTPVQPGANLVSQYQIGNEDASSATEALPERSELVIMKAEKVKKIGSGSYGYVCEMKCGEQKYAGKFFHESHIEGPDFSKRFSTESKIMSQLHHENIVKYIGKCVPPESPYCLLMQLMECSLEAYIMHASKSTDDIPFPVKHSMMFDVAKGLLYLHKKSVIHRDLTPRNVLLTYESSSSSSSPLIAKIADFGNGRFVDMEDASRLSLTAKPGTWAYMPPEALEGGHYDHSVDVFSFGNLVLFTITQEQIVMRNLKPTKQTDSTLPPRTECERREYYVSKLNSHDTIKEQVIMCLNDKPKERPAVSQLISCLQARLTQEGNSSDGNDDTTDYGLLH